MWPTQCKPNIDLQQLLGLIKATECLKNNESMGNSDNNFVGPDGANTSMLWHSLLHKINTTFMSHLLTAHCLSGEVNREVKQANK